MEAARSGSPPQHIKRRAPRQSSPRQNARLTAADHPGSIDGVKAKSPIARLEGDCFGEADVRVRKVRGTETISRLFRFEIEVFVPSAGLDVAPWEGEAIALCFDVDGVEARRISGEIAEVHDNLDDEARLIVLVLVPRARRLTLVTTQEIYMGLSVPEILRQKLDGIGLSVPSAVKLSLSGEYPPLEFVVQYKESDLDFVQRLAEHAGISYFFEEEGADRLVFTDHKAGFHPVAGLAEVPFRPRGERRDIFELTARRRSIPAVFIEQDYNYRTPLVDLTGSAPASLGRAGGVVDYAPHVKSPEAAAALARIRAEEADSTHLVYQGKSDVCGLSAGAVVTAGHHGKLGDTPLLLVSVEHRLSQVAGPHQSEGGEGYENAFTAIDAALTYRPPRLTPKPRIHGLLTGVIEPDLPGDETRFSKVDESGRYTVRFLFDTAPPGERKASRPVRMIQAHAGPGYGVHLPLKPGIEVLLAFLDGDPDRPLIVGAAPNPLTPSPVSRANATANRIVTETGIVIEMKDA